MLKEYIKRGLICVTGLALYGLCNVFCLKAGDVGTNAWNTLALGISDISSISFGSSTLLISVFIVLLDLLGRGKLGFGTLLNALLIPFFSDLFLVLFSFFPVAPNMFTGLVYTLCAQLGISFATIVYMQARLGCGPRDTLMVIIGRRLSRIPIGAVKFIIEAAALIAGVALGAPFGLGTVLVLLLQASMFQLACTICKYEPRSIIHEDFLDTLKRLSPKA